MKFLILAFALYFSSTAQAQLFSSTYKLKQPSTYNHNALFLRPQGTADDVRDVVNLYAASVGYSFSTNMIRNGSGTESARPLKAAGTLSQALRTLSMFDMYLTHGVEKKEKDPAFRSPVSLDFVGMSSSQEYFQKQRDILPEIQQQGLKPAYDLIAPIFSGNIRELPYDYKVNPTFIEEAHKGIKNIVARQWPMYEPSRTAVDRLMWMAESYMPILTQGEMWISPKWAATPSKLHIETFLPQVGELVGNKNTPPEQWYIKPIIQDLTSQKKEIHATPVVIDEISLGKFQRPGSTRSPAIKISIDKDFAKINELDVTIEFGHVYTNTNKYFATLGYSEPEEALVARGRLETRGMGGVRVRLAFHRLALKLIRKPSATWKEAFENDFSFEDVKVIREKSVKSLSLHVPSHRYDLRAALATFTTGFGECDASNYCSYVISPTTNFQGVNQYDPNTYFFPLRALLLNFVNKKADNSIDNLIPQALKDADKMADQVAATVLEQLESARGLISGALVQLGNTTQR